MRTPEPVTLSGRHVTLEPLSVAHADDLFEAGDAAEVWAWLSYPRPATRDDMARQVQHALDDPTRLPFAVVVDGRACGSTSIGDIDLDVEGVEIGWTWYAPRLWATEVNPESKLLLLEHCFDALGVQRVFLKTDGRNARSQAAIRKLGAQHDGTLRHHRRRGDGSVRDSVYFSILAAEWPAVRRGLEERLGR